jgi:hypothetical protein
MLPKILSQDFNCKGGCGKCTCITPEESLEAYKEAAKSDSYMFGEYNGYEAYGDIPD